MQANLFFVFLLAGSDLVNIISGVMDQIFCPDWWWWSGDLFSMFTL